MQSYRFIMNDEAPWGVSTTAAQKKLEQGKNYLVEGNFAEAHRCFTAVANEHDHAPNDKLWGYLLSSYNMLIGTYYGFKFILDPTTILPLEAASTPLVKLDYQNACLINKDLAKEEYEQYEPVAVFLKQIILFGSIHNRVFDFQTLHEQAWCTYLAEIFTHNSNWENAEKEIQKGLTKIPDNHYLISYKAIATVTQGENETLAEIIEAQKAINQAIDLCPKVVQTSADLAYHYFVRAQINTLKLPLVNSLEQTRIQPEIINDYQNTFKSDCMVNTFVDQRTYLRLLNFFSNTSFLKNENIDENYKKKLTVINQLISKDNTKVDLYLQRGEVYAALGKKNLAHLDYIIAFGLIRMGIVSVTEAYREKVEKVLVEFTKTNSPTEVMYKTLEVKANELVDALQLLEKSIKKLEIKQEDKPELSYLFIIKNQAPWGASITPLQQKLQEGRDYLVANEFDKAMLCFDQVSKQPLSISTSTSTAQVWAFLLLGYTNIVLSQMTDDPSKSEKLIFASSLNYRAARAMNTLADEEFLVYERIKQLIKQVMIMQIEQNEKRDFQKLNEQAWFILRAFNLIAIKDYHGALELALEGLAKMPKNHILHFVKYAAYSTGTSYNDKNSEKLISRAEEAINEAIKLCPKNSFHLPRHYYHRGALIDFKLSHLKKSESTSRLRLIRKAISDYQFFLQGDTKDEYEDLTKDNRMAILIQIQKIHFAGDEIQIAKSEKTKLQHLLAQITRNPIQVNYYVERAAIYHAAGENALAYLDYSTAIWLLRTKMAALTRHNQTDLEARLAKLTVTHDTKQAPKNKEPHLLPPPTKVAEKIPKESASEIKKPNKSSETPEARAAREDKKINQEVELVLRDMIVQIKRQFRLEEEEKKKEEKAAKEKADKLQKNIRLTHQFITGLIQKRIVDPAYAQIKEKRLQTNQFITDLIQQKIVDPAYAEITENQRLQSEVQAVVFDLVNQVEEKENKQQEEKELQRLESIYQQEESIPFKPLAHAWFPREVLEAGKGIKDLPGRIAKRTIVYGGTAGDAALLVENKKMDFDLLTGLPLALVAPVLTKVFNLSNEPKELHGILTVNFTVEEKGQKAQLTIRHSPDLANKKLSYLEALRQVMFRLDFLQKAFIASFPHGSVHYPLNWWEFYFATSLTQALNQINKSRTAEKWSGTLKALSCPALIFIGKDKNFQVYFYVNDTLEAIIKSQKRELVFLNLQLKESDYILRTRDAYGKVIPTCQNQKHLLKLLSEVDQLYQIHFQKPLQSLNKDITLKIAAIKNIESILEPNHSFSTDPTRILRLIYFTTSMKFHGLSKEMYAAVLFQAKAYNEFVAQNPGKVNSWLNKIFCRDGKHFFTENLNNFKRLGLLEISFPGLKNILENNGPLKKWLGIVFEKMIQSEHPSLNYLYAIFITCLSLRTKQPVENIIQSYSLFRENFKEIAPDSYLQQASDSWKYFLKTQPGRQPVFFAPQPNAAHQVEPSPNVGAWRATPALTFKN